MLFIFVDMDSYIFRHTWKSIKKGIALFRDNMIITQLNKCGFPLTAKAYNWLTTETLDTAILFLAGKIGLSTISSKYIILVIIAFL